MKLATTLSFFHPGNLKKNSAMHFGAKKHIGIKITFAYKQSLVPS